MLIRRRNIHYGKAIKEIMLVVEFEPDQAFAVAGRCLVKAAGGVRELSEILEFLKAGARRFGSTRTEQFVQDLPEQRKADFGEFLIDLSIEAHS